MSFSIFPSFFSFLHLLIPSSLYLSPSFFPSCMLTSHPLFLPSFLSSSIFYCLLFVRFFSTISFVLMLCIYFVFCHLYWLISFQVHSLHPLSFILLSFKNIDFHFLNLFPITQNRTSFSYQPLLYLSHFYSVLFNSFPYWFIIYKLLFSFFFPTFHHSFFSSPFHVSTFIT